MIDNIKQIIKKFLNYQARVVLARYKPKVLVVIGGVGKTLTKEAIYLTLQKKFSVRKNQKSFTNEIGVPMTVLGIGSFSGSYYEIVKEFLLSIKLVLTKSQYPEWLVLELDTDRPGDLHNISKWLKPDMVVFTATGSVPSHVESFRDIDSLGKEYLSLLYSVGRDGVVFYNADDSFVNELLSGVNCKKVSCGSTPKCDFYAEDFSIKYSEDKKNKVPVGNGFVIHVGEMVYPLDVLGSVGIQNQYSSVLAFAVGSELGVPHSTILNQLEKVKPIPGRMRIIPGIKDTLIIDDSYNASPVAMRESISMFLKIKTGKRKILVLGDMLELGKYSVDEHKKMAELLKKKVGLVLCVGFRMRKLVDELLASGFPESNIISFDDSYEAGRALQNLLNLRDVVLVKGSQAMRMERVVEEVMANPEQKDKLLVRQEEEWLER